MGGHDGQSIPKLVGYLDKLVGHWYKLLEGAMTVQTNSYNTVYTYTRVGQEATTTSVHMHICTLNHSHMHGQLIYLASVLALLK